MAFLRQSYPGQPIAYVDLGPCTGRISAQGFAIRGGPIDRYTIGPTDGRAIPALRREPGARYVGDWPRCGRTMRTGEACARRKGHSVGYCRSAESVERENARRRARDFA